MRESKFIVIEQTMNNPDDYNEGYVLYAAPKPLDKVSDALEFCRDIAESTSRALNSSGDYNTIAVHNKVIDANTQRVVACYYIQPTTIETFT